MARIRTIKPEFFTSENIVALTPLSRLFYVSLWLEADREGRLEWKPKTFKLRYFPADDCDIEKMGKELVDAGLIVLYEDDKYAEIPSFSKHQVINNREAGSEIPARVKEASPRVSAEGRKEGKEGNARQANADGVFIMPNDWKPSDHFPSLLKNAGLVLTDPDLQAGVGEYIAYWLTRKSHKTQSEWDQGLLKSLLNQRAAKAAAEPKGAVRSV